tara:strand:+ start:1437 stop:1772 length:336 start_codon:yes stop_codon:yes gene_type:complete
MGSAPSVDGGMTEEQYERLQMEEREWQAEMEAEKYAQAMAYEKETREYEQSQKEQLEAQKNAEGLALEQGELAIQNEVTAQADEEEDDSNMDGSFYDALANNSSMNEERPE